MEADFYRQYFALEGRHWWFLGRRKIFLRLIRSLLPAGNQEILDFGCGTGAFLPHLEQFGRVSAVDGDHDAVAFCHQRGRTEVLHVAPEARLPFGDGQFDLVTTFDVLEHIEDDVATMSELRRVLKPGGALVAAVPAFMFLWGDQDEISHHFRRYRADDLSARLRAAGFSVEKTSYFNTLLFPPIAALRLIRRRLRAPTAERTDFTIGPPRLNTLLGRAFGAEAPIVARARLPFGVSVLAVARR
jgi:SAM-dependent methyltransferase